VEAQILEGATGAEALKVALAELDKLLPSLAAAPPAFSLRAHALLRLGRCAQYFVPLPRGRPPCDCIAMARCCPVPCMCAAMPLWAPRSDK